MDDSDLIQEAASAELGMRKAAHSDVYVLAMARKLLEIEQEMAQASTQQMAVNNAMLGAVNDLTEMLSRITGVLERKEDRDG